MDKLRAQLAMLEDQAKIYGIDPEAEDEAGGIMGRGGHSSRGASFRGRGYTPRRRGAFRGQEGRHVAYAQYSIDNRPKKLAVTGVDFTSSEKDEILRHYLLVRIF
jgi:RNA-binding protein 26